ncbi:MAG: hypothetical protein SFX19_01705 [Alphaproteobacteria bacterium]|nr:hypothetical protein [Alphaproteobacteria bacterium]
MSLSKNDQLFPSDTPTQSTQKIANSIAKVLRQDYGEISSAVKRIGRITGVHPRAIRNWYEGRNAPNSLHLLMLARSSPNVLRVLLELIGYGHLAESINWVKISPNRPLHPSSVSEDAEIYGEKFFTINVMTTPDIAAKLNQRQLWFLGLLQAGEEAKPNHIVTTWEVTLRTARADVTGLMKRQLICFVGAKKNGKYALAKIASPIRMGEQET